MSDTVLRMPLLPLRGIVLLPGVTIPVYIGRSKSVAAIKRAMMEDYDGHVLVVAQQDSDIEAPKMNDLFNFGVRARIMRLDYMQDGTCKAFLKGIDRIVCDEVSTTEDGFVASYRVQTSEPIDAKNYDSLCVLLQDKFEFLTKLSRNSSAPTMEQVVAFRQKVASIDSIVHLLSQPLRFSLAIRQRLLETLSESERFELLIAEVSARIELLEIEDRIQVKVRKQVDRNQREYFLNEQMKAIQREMQGEDGEDEASVLDELTQKIAEAKLTQEAKKKAESELRKLKMMPPMSAESTVVRNYLEWLIALPWMKKRRVSKDIKRAKKQLDADHYGLEDVKDRILEYLASHKYSGKLKAPVLCLVGPPGVGKTSLGASIAKATNREYVRLALGGMRDEAEIRGHRRTYIGSMPGKILQRISKSGVNNPLFLLDEIDKMGMDHRGDVASALLEVLDPEQNQAFGDHYLELDYDLSDVLFVCTSNSMQFPEPLRDRLEVIRLSGYTEDEKLNIAKQFLLPKHLQEHGVTKRQLQITDEAILCIVRDYTREAGVRALSRLLSRIVRKVLLEHEFSGAKKLKPVTIGVDEIQPYLGVKQFTLHAAHGENEIGVVTGLAWTQFGGDLLDIEVNIMPGKGNHLMTGSLGDVMQESISAAMTLVRTRSLTLGLKSNHFSEHDIHVHMPEGATPKDGPSAGIGIFTALFSLLSATPVRSDTAMTGELTIRGKVLPIGGLKEKLLAAQRGGIKQVLIPKANAKDLEEIADRITEGLTVHLVEDIDEVLERALEHFEPHWRVPITKPESVSYEKAH